MVKFIVGKANCDISEAVRGELVSLIRSGEKRNIVYIVPDQFEYETERGIYKILEENELLRRSGEIRITTFAGLSSEMLKIGGENRVLADGTIKNILMHKVLLEQKSELSVLLRISAKQGFCEKMLRTAAMFKTAGISAKELNKRINDISDENITEMPFMKKLVETEMLYTWFEAEMSDYIDEPDTAGLAAEIIAKESCRLFENADIFVDCFNDFTYNQLLILNELIRKSQNITFGFTSDVNSGSEVFLTANTNIGRLTEQAKRNDIPVIVTDCAVFRTEPSSPLGILSENLFLGKKDCGSADGNIEIISAVNVYEELDFAAAKIKQLTSESGIRYKDIAVLCTDLGGYKKYIENTFKKYDIPFFTDTRESIIHRPLINAVISLLNALRSFSVDTVLSCVKTGFFSKFNKKKNKRTGLSASDVNVFENYIFEWALETNHLKKPFTFATRGDMGNGDIEEEYDEDGNCTEIELPEDKRTPSERARDQAEEIRESIVKPIWELSKKFSGRNSIRSGAKITEMLYDFLVNKVDISCAVHAKCRIRQKDGSTVLDREQVTLYQRLWDALIGIFDKLHEELSDTDIAFSDYCGLFRDLCEETTLAAPPQYIDSVLVGDIDRTRADNIKAAFILGASYDSFPTHSAPLGIFSEYDMELIRKNLFGAEGSDCGLKSSREQYNLSLYRAYKAVCLPTEYLCLSCPDSDTSGEPLEPSTVITDIAGLFCDVETRKASSFGDKFYCRSPESVKMRCAFGINAPSRDNALLKEVLIKNGERDFVETLDEIKNSHQDKPLNDEELYAATNAEPEKNYSGKHTISPVIARLLFPTKLGASSVEKISECRFKFFCQYGLNIKDRIQRDFNSNKRGEAIHFIFEHILKEYRNEIFKFDRTDFYNLSLMYLEKYFLAETNNDFSENMRTDFLFRNTANTAADVLLTIQAELFPRGYVPKFFELDIDGSDKKMIIKDECKNAVQLPPPALYAADNGKLIPTPPAAAEESDKYILTEPFAIQLENGLRMTIAGRIDRVDLLKSNDDYYFRVVDYKSAVHCFDPHEAAKYGIHTQMLLYLFALYKANLDNPNFTLRPGGVSYLPSRNEGAADELLGAYRLLAMNYHQSGLLIADDVTRSDYNAYVEYIKNRIAQSEPDFDAMDEKGKAEYINSLENGILKSYDIENTSYTDAADFDVLRGEVTNGIKTKLDTLYSGGVSAIPQVYYEKRFDINGKIKKSTYPADPCAFCKFSEICGNRNINVFKIKEEKEPLRKKKEDDKDGE